MELVLAEKYTYFFDTDTDYYVALSTYVRNFNPVYGTAIGIEFDTLGYNNFSISILASEPTSIVGNKLVIDKLFREHGVCFTGCRVSVDEHQTFVMDYDCELDPCGYVPWSACGRSLDECNNKIDRYKKLPICN